VNVSRLLIYLTVLVLFGTTNVPAQDLQRFCKDLQGALADVKKSHPEWPYSAPTQFNDCSVIIEKNYWTDATRLLQVWADVSKTDEQAIGRVDEYRTRIEKGVSDRKRLNPKLIDEKAEILDLAPRSTGWQSLYRWDYARNRSVIFGRYNKLYVQITTEEFPFVDVIQTFLTTYKFNQ